MTAAKTEGCYYIRNTLRGNYIEWYAEKNNWSSYGTINHEELFAQKFYKVTDLPQPHAAELPEEGAAGVLYNKSAGQYGHEGVLGLQDDNETSPSILDVSAVLQEGKAVPTNGGVVFTVEKNGEWYRFHNETFGYLASNGTGSNAFYTTEVSEDIDWALTELNGGFRMMSRTAKYNGKYDQYLEYFGGSYKTYSYYPTDKEGKDVKDIYTFYLHPVAEDVRVTDGVVNLPSVTFGTLPTAFVGQDYTFTVTVDAAFGVNALTVKAGETELAAGEDGSYTIPAASLTEGTLTITVSGTDRKGTAISGSAEITVKDEPVISNMTPAPNSQTGEEKHP